MRKKVISSLLVSAMVLALSGCSSTSQEVATTAAATTAEATTAEATTEEVETESEDSSRIKELVIANNAESTTLWNPINGWGQYDDPLFQSKLIRLANAGEIKPDLATTYESNEDASVWTFYLREDVYFSDGVQLTSADVAFTIETCIKEATSLDYSMVTKIETPDDYTVILTLDDPDSNFVYRISTLGIVPAHCYDEMYSENPIGSGPFMMVQWDKGQQAILEPNPYYFGEESNVDRIVMLFMDQQTALAAVQAGTVDVAYANTTTALTQVAGYTLEKMECVDNVGVGFPMVAPQGKNEDGEEVGNAVTSDLAIRRAFSYAADREYFSNDVLDGFATPSYSLCTGMDWFNEETILEDCSLEEGIRILEEGGWLDSDGDGIREKDGVRAEFQLYYPADNALRQSVAFAFAQLGAELGVEIETVGASWDDIFANWHAQPYIYAAGNFTPSELYNSISSTTAGLAYSNAGYYSNEVVDGYMAKAMASADKDEANELWQMAQWDGETGSSMLGDNTVCWLVNINHMFFVREGLNVGEQQMQSHGDFGMQILNNVSEWYWE